MHLSIWQCKVLHSLDGKYFTSRCRYACCTARLIAQAYDHCCYRGCIFESLPGKPSRLLAVDYNTYVQQRSLWPCCPSACKLLLGTKVTHLVAALLGCPSANMHDCPRLFNDQVCCLTESAEVAVPCHVMINGLSCAQTSCL